MHGESKSSSWASLEAWGLSLLLYPLPPPKLGMQGFKEVCMSLDFENIKMLKFFFPIIEEKLSQCFLLWRVPSLEMTEWLCSVDLITTADSDKDELKH